MPRKADIQIFLAHASEDKATVLELYEQLKAAGYKPWIDCQDLLPGQNWRAAIPQALKNSQIFIACFSGISVAKRGYIQKEFRMAMEELSNIPPDQVFLIPLRLDACEIPDYQQFEYGLRLRDYQWVDYWQSDGFERLTQAIDLQLGWGESTPEEPEQNGEIERYIERPPIESRCFNEVIKPGAVIRIQAPQQMGTTMLMNRIFDYATEQHGYRTVLINLLRANEATLQDLDKFFKWFCKQVGRQLGLENQVAEYWEEDSGPNDNCTIYFEDYLFANIDTPLVLGIENLDCIFPYPTVMANFLGWLRAGHEEAKIMDSWKKLRLVLGVSTDEFIRLNIEQSPFNVGLPIELPEFSLDQVQELANKYGLNWTVSQCEQLMAVVGGHPYLVDLTFNEVKVSSQPLAEILHQAHTESGIFRRHLRKLWLALEDKSYLVTVLKEIVNTEQPVTIDRDRLFELDSLGLIKKQGNKVEPRCYLYRRYFQDLMQ